MTITMMPARKWLHAAAAAAFFAASSLPQSRHEVAGLESAGDRQPIVGTEVNQEEIRADDRSRQGHFGDREDPGKHRQW